LRQKIELFDVIGRKKRPSVGIASISDFNLYPRGELAEADNRPALAYCFDIKEQCMWFTLCDDLDRLRRSPFLYAAQYQGALQVLRVPFALLPWPAARAAARQCFIFSLGRCGSTLLTGLVNECGVCAVSEPDPFTQLAKVGGTRRGVLGQDLFNLIAHSCASSLLKHDGENIVVKLRSQCNGSVEEMVRAFPAARFVFMLREPLGWANSRYRAFGGRPEALAQMYKWGLESFDRLVSVTCDTLLIWYEDLVRDPVSTLRELAEFGVPILLPDGHAVEQTMKRDSQRDTPLASQELHTCSMSASQVQAFEKELEKIGSRSAPVRHLLERQPWRIRKSIGRGID
jgi:hypothetical protein